MRRIRRVAATVRLMNRMQRHNVKAPYLVIREARRANLGYAHALALLEKETGIPQRNVFGCDLGPRSSVPYCNQEVTKERVQALIRHIRAGGASNGVGWTQLTYPPFIYQAERRGGAHKPKYQMRIGFRVLADHIRQYGPQDGAARYNGSGSAAEEYGRDFVARAKRWHKRLS